MPVARRLCEGCERPLPADAHPNRRYHDGVCAKLARRRADDAFGRQGTLTFPGPRSGANARSGLQLSLPKARRALIARLWHFPDGERLIDEALRAALPDRQRAALDRRTQPTQEVA